MLVTLLAPNIQKLISEGNTLIVVQALNKDDSNRSKFLSPKSSRLTISLTPLVHIRRNLNGVTHLLMNAALTIQEEHVLLDAISLCISDVILMKCYTSYVFYLREAPYLIIRDETRRPRDHVPSLNYMYIWA